MRRFLLSIFALVALLVVSSAGFAQQQSASTAEQRKAELDAALEAAFKAAQAGPQSIRLGDQGSLALPEGYIFIPVTESRRLMLAMGNRTGETFRGLVLSAKGENWLTVIDFNKVGYVKDDDAKSWKADELLQQLKDGTEAANGDRRERGFGEIVVAGWVEPPAYDATSHRLVWSALVKDKAATANATASVNYNTYALGREGFYQLNLITGSDRIESEKSHAKALLASLNYDAGKRYADFNPSTDRVAEFGLAALIAGAAAKKLGLFAALGVLLLKFWKVAALAIVGFGALAGKLFGRRASS